MKRIVGLPLIRRPKLPTKAMPGNPFAANTVKVGSLDPFLIALREIGLRKTAGISVPAAVAGLGAASAVGYGGYKLLKSLRDSAINQNAERASYGFDPPPQQARFGPPMQAF
jgi:hypothetical protein